MRAVMIAVIASLTLVGCSPDLAGDWTPGPVLAFAGPAGPTAPPAAQQSPPPPPVASPVSAVPSCSSKGPNGRTWGHLCMDPKGPRSAELVCCEIRRGDISSAAVAPEAAPEAPTLTCPAGLTVRTMRCDGAGELLRPTCKPCKGKGAKGKRAKRGKAAVK